MKWNWWLTSCITVIALLTLREAVFFIHPALHVRVCQTGQGDAVLLRTPSNKVVLIDGGPNIDVLTDLGEFMPWFKRSIDVVVLTHPDADHITALPSVLRRYDIGAIFMTGIEHHSGKHSEFLALIAAHNIPIIVPEPNQLIDFGDGVTLQTIWPQNDIFGTVPNDANHTSVVLRAVYNNQSILLTGDIDASAEAAILASGTHIQSTYLKVPHHGSITSSSTGFLLAVRPAMAVVSTGKDNKFHHPHTEVVQRYQALNIPLHNTATNGDFELVFR